MTHVAPFSRRSVLAVAGSLALGFPRASAATSLDEIRVDYATYNPLSLVVRAQKLLETAFAPTGTAVRWVLSLGSNKALEFLNAGSLDIGSTAGAAALIGRVNGNPIKTVATYSRPEWTALVAAGGSTFTSPADLRGRRIAVTRGTDPHIFLIRALEVAGLSERDVKLVLLQHPDGRTALLRGDVDAWAGLDPLMAQAEIENSARLVYRNTAFNSAGVLNVREAFATAQPDAVRRVLGAYEQARQWALANPAPFQALLVDELRLPAPVVARQLERTDLSAPVLTTPPRDTLVAAGDALQKAGVFDAGVSVGASVDALLDGRFAGRAG